jgi:DNA-binding response OmpR family regulator
MTGDARIIIVEDNLPLARAVARWLCSQGYAALLAGGLADFRAQYAERGADLVLLDLNLGGEDGLTLARELREERRLGLIIMTGRDEVQDRVRGLDAGADDYVVKPFAMEELGARVRAVLRRRLHLPDADRVIRLGPVALDLVRSELHGPGRTEPVRLTERQRDILQRLIAAAGEVVDRVELQAHHPWEPGDRSIDVHVSAIRRKLAATGMQALQITSVRSRGYRLDLIRTTGDMGAPTDGA